MQQGDVPMSDRVLSTVTAKETISAYAANYQRPADGSNSAALPILGKPSLTPMSGTVRWRSNSRRIWLQTHQTLEKQAQEALEQLLRQQPADQPEHHDGWWKLVIEVTQLVSVPKSSCIVCGLLSP